MIISAKLLALACRKLNIAPLLGELCAGIILGPSLLNIIPPAALFKILAEIGVILLLFEVGLHTDLSRLLNTGKKAFMVAGVGFILPSIFGFLLARYFQFSVLSALFIGGTLSATSIGITLRVLSDLNKQHSDGAQIILGAAILDDIFGVLLLSVLYNFSNVGTVNLLALFRLASLIVIFVGLAPILIKIIFWGIEQIFGAKLFEEWLLIFTLLLIAILSWLAYEIGAPSIMGGFVAGLALSRQFGFKFKRGTRWPLIKWVNQILTSENLYFDALTKRIKPFVQLLTPIFFVMVGVSLNLSGLHALDKSFWYFSTSLVLLAFLSKFIAGFCVKAPVRLQAMIGTAMIPRGEVGLIFASLGLTSGIVTHELYACLITVIALTTLLPPLILKILAHRI
jgi:Kef-type K+ transport system membrane component KefB